jgi:hypothetical protein
MCTFLLKVSFQTRRQRKACRHRQGVEGIFGLGNTTTGAFAKGESDMIEGLARYWWAFLVRGLLAVVFGVLAYAWPTISLTAFIIIFGVYAFADGFFWW